MGTTKIFSLKIPSGGGSCRSSTKNPPLCILVERQSMKAPPRKTHTEFWWNVSFEGYTKFKLSPFLVECPVIWTPLKTGIART